MNDVEREDISIIRREALQATCLEGTVIDLVLEMLQLDTRMDGTMLLIDRILVHDDDDRPTLRFGIRSNSPDLDLGELMVIDASDVDSAPARGDEVNVIASDYSIDSTIDEGSRS